MRHDNTTLTHVILRRYDWLALPHNVEAAPNEAVVRMQHFLSASADLLSGS